MPKIRITDHETRHRGATTMAVHRISPRAELLLQRMAASERKKPSQFLHDLIVDYAAGLTFEDDPDLERLPAPDPDVPAALHARPNTNEEG
jgi:hypothetical protein